MNANRTAAIIATLFWTYASASGAQDFQLRISPIEPLPAEHGSVNWDSLGSTSSLPDKPATLSKGILQRKLPDGIQARKAEMVRRMFWLVLAYR